MPIDKRSLKEEEEEVKEDEKEEGVEEEESKQVEEETWKDKNKLLEMTEGGVSLQFIKPEENKKQEKVFVQ